ncbi:MAG TPA: hypothetical protein DCQ84_15865 [Candidatus Competibacteraceae bacterium]|nr:hypothetical protein [Candidatus Competibacteraceae bacterium]
MPELTGMTQSTAISVLQNTNLTIGQIGCRDNNISPGPAPVDTVASQYPSAGSLVPRGSAVDIDIYRSRTFPCDSVMP